MAIIYGTRFTSLPNWGSSTDSFSRVQFNGAFDQLDVNAAGWSESNIAASGTTSGFFHYNTTDNSLKVYSTGETAWVLVRDGYEMRSSTVDAKGDLLGGTADNAIGRLAVGTNDQALVANSSAGTGLAWANVVNSITGTGNEVEVDASTGSITIGLPSAVTIGTLTIDSVGISTIQTGSESFADNDTSVMTSAAVQDKILGYSYATVADTIPIATIDAKGDLLVGSADDTVVNVGIGADGRVLSADASAAGGMVWSTTVTSVTGTAAQISLSDSSGAVTIGLPNDVAIVGTLTLDSVGIAAVQSSGESFADNDTSVMTSAAIQDKIEAYGYSTTANTISSVGGTSNEIEVGLVSGVATVGLPNNVTITGTLTVDSVGIATVQTGSESFADNDTSLMTSAAVQDKILAYAYATTASATLKGTLTTKGDIYARSSSAPARLAVGSNNQALLADSTETKGMKWAAVVNSVSGTAAEVVVSASTGSVTIGLPDDITIAGTLTLDSVGIAAVQTSAESFADNNTSIMTSGAIADKIENYGYITASQAIISVTGTSNEVEAFTSSGAVTVGLPDDVTIAGTLTLNSVGIAAVQTGSGSFSDNDTSIMTSAAVQDKILAYSYATTTQLNAFQTTIDDVETMFHMEVMV
ncbi:MAG: hypothetical protein HOI21_00530 [Bacteroidetes Order II. Incertae sedis bacterium]|jgi:hypothetical protein|nr:hypothetical protein [Bacteroidetes Order II. bacterium]